jgi:hypothetical protein
MCLNNFIKEYTQINYSHYNALTLICVVIFEEDMVNLLFKLVVKKYMKAGAGQYLRDFCLAYR